MKTFPNDYLEASASASRKYHIYVAVGTVVNGFYEDTYEYDENDIISLKIVFGATTGGFAIGETICGTLEMTVSRNFNVADGNRITVYVAFETATGSLTARQKIGRFYIDKLSRTEFTQNFTAYDKMIQQEKVFIQGVALEYPTTVSLMLDRIADVKNLEISPSIDIFNNASINSAPITEDLHPYTVRQVLGWLAALNGANAYIDSELNICFAAPKAANYTIQRSEVISENITEGSRVISQVLFDNGDLNPALFDETDPDAVFIETKLDLADSEAALAPINTKLKNFTYNGVTIKKQGTGRFELGDVVTYSTVDTEGNAVSYTMLIGGIVYDFSGGFFSETLYSNADSRSEREFAGSKQSDPIAGGGGGGVTPTPSEDTAISEYEYVSDRAVKVNGITYSITKSSSNVITKISDDKGGEVIPIITANVADKNLHNAVVWAAAISRGLAPEILMPVMDGIVGFFDYNSIDLAHHIWKSKVGGNNITFDEGATDTHEISGYLHKGLNLPAECYAHYTVEEPAIIYLFGESIGGGAVFSADPILHKHLVSDINGTDFAFYDDNSRMRLYNRGNSLLVSDNNVNIYAGYCYSRTGNTASAYYKSGSFTPYKGTLTANTSNYAGEYTFNSQFIGGDLVRSNQHGFWYRMVAFGTKPHSEEDIMKNLNWLYNKYDYWSNNYTD